MATYVGGSHGVVAVITSQTIAGHISFTLSAAHSAVGFASIQALLKLEGRLSDGIGERHVGRVDKFDDAHASAVQNEVRT
jgi:hypothetical protein